ncbi:hypothetical protein [Nostoc sp. CCY 9925]|uniref:hypothetical protein n=1 Tax=Nostoc sp. CCY 9925 TaxID=3103865 RepID=UPI0039C64967
MNILVAEFMSQITRILPDGEKLEIDLSHFKQLLYKATSKTLDLLKSVSVNDKIRVIWRIDEKSYYADNVAFPNYRDQKVWQRIENIWDSNEVIALTDYLWEHNAVKKSITGPDQSEIEWKKSWARFIFGDFVHRLLLSALENAGICDFVDGKEIIPWSLKELDLQSALEKFVEEYKELNQGKEKFTAYCLFSAINLPDGITEVELAEGIKVRSWSQRERLIFNSLHHHEFLWDDFKQPTLLDVIVEIKVTLNSGESPLSPVEDLIDLVKWGLITVSQSDTHLPEGVCLIFNRTSSRLYKLRRDDNLGSSQMSLSAEQITLCKKIIGQFLSCAKVNPDIKNALWHFGRSCTSVLDRDILLEAAIGIDSLTTQRGGDSRYKFCLHSAALIATVKQAHKKVDYQKLKKIYDQRSCAAHGGKQNNLNQLKILALDARKALALIILAIIDLTSNGIINLKSERNSENTIASAVEKYVISKVTIVTRYQPDILNN